MGRGAPLAIELHLQHSGGEGKVLDDGVGMGVEQAELAGRKVRLLSCSHKRHQRRTEEHPGKAASKIKAGSGAKGN